MKCDTCGALIEEGAPRLLTELKVWKEGDESTHGLFHVKTAGPSCMDCVRENVRSMNVEMTAAKNSASRGKETDIDIVIDIEALWPDPAKRPYELQKKG